MEQTIFKVAGEEFTITREKILSAMREYDTTYRHDENDAGRNYAIRYGEKLYPPKHLLSLVIQKPRGSFTGGRATNTVFLKLGLEVVQINNVHATTGRPKKTNFDQARINAPIPDVQDLIQRLLSLKKWTNLHTGRRAIEDREYPGVYVLAYSDKALEGEPVKVEDVFYVGMTQASLIQRLNQFVRGIEDGKHHSGASRFYYEYAKQVPYSRLPNSKTFFVASAAIPCIVSKKRRTPQDLRKMGEVARLELYVLAHIKEVRSDEPELNKK
jgi:hypothetical protein